MGIIRDFVGAENPPGLDFKVNAIIDFWSNPCDVPWTVYIETLYPAFGQFFLTIIDTSLLDIAREYLRPRQGLTRGNNRKKGRRRGRRGIPMVDGQMIGRLIPGARTLAGMEYGRNTQFLWQVDGIIQRGLWYVVLIDASADFFYYWAAGIKEIGFCKPINRPGMFLSHPNPQVTAFFGQWYPSPGWSPRWKEPGYNWHITTISTPPGRHQIIYRSQVVNSSDFFGQAEVRFRPLGPGPSASVIVPPQSTRDLVFSGEFDGGSFGILEQRALGTPWMSGKDGAITIRKA